MFGYDKERRYSFAAVGLKKNHDRIFCSREAAVEYMYGICAKYGLRIDKVWDDRHDKTYICNNGVAFHINRAW